MLPFFSLEIRPRVVYKMFAHITNTKLNTKNAATFAEMSTFFLITNDCLKNLPGSKHSNVYMILQICVYCLGMQTNTVLFLSFDA